MDVPAMNQIEAAIGKDDDSAGFPSLSRNRAEIVDALVLGRHGNRGYHGAVWNSIKVTDLWLIS
jgi:hypothetical protein